MELDDNSQPRSHLGWHHNLIKSLESPLGICRGLIADNELNEREIAFFDAWLKENEEVAKAWPGDVIARRVRDVLADGVVSQEDSEDLNETLSQITGEFLKNGLLSGVSTSLPSKKFIPYYSIDRTSALPASLSTEAAAAARWPRIR